MTVVISGIRTKPSHFEVDPYNGYLFWSIDGTSDDSGLFRVDLSFVSNGVPREIKPFVVMAASNISAFTIDYAQFSLFIPNKTMNTIYQIDFDGKKEEDIRQNTQSAEFQSVTSIAIANKKFYWTNGSSIFREESHLFNKKFYHMGFVHFANVDKYLFVSVNMQSAQPIPVPTHPPSNVQVVLSARSGKVSWNAPHLLSIQGASSWQDWNYVIEIINEDANKTKVMVRGIKGLTHLVSNLLPNTNYSVRVAVCTIGGTGQFSSEFRAKTLRTPHQRYLMWSSNDGLLQSDILGDHIQVLVPKIEMASPNITGIAWYEDVIYYISNYTLFYLNRTTGLIGKLSGSESVQSIAVDWIGKRLYWFNPLHSVINRGNLQGGDQEALLSLTARVTDLKIDSHRGYMYFSSGHSVEYCRLNGRQCAEYYREMLYSGRQVMGLTLDMDNERVYWIVRSYGSSSLFSAPMAGTSATDFKAIENVVAEKEIQGPLSYFSDRLLWPQDDHTVVISNVNGTNLAHLRHIKLNGLKAFAIIDPTQQTHPSNASPHISVVPENLNVSSIRVTGTSQSFSISWDPAKNVNYGQVFYEIQCMNISVEDSPHSYIQIQNATLPPYSPISIFVRAFTYWGSSKVMKAQLHSPAAAPSKPTSPRLFLTHSYDVLNGGLNITATLRWNPPISPNGPLVAYKINCWYDKDGITGTALWNADVPADRNEKIIGNLLANATYFIEICASSSVGMGNFTAPLSINTNHERPVPHVMVATSDAIWAIDLDLQQEEMVVKTRTPATHMAYIGLHRELFWIDEAFNVMALKNGNRYRLCNASMQVLSMGVDWIERQIYWSQIDKHAGSALYAFDLNKNKLVNVLRSDGYIYGLTVVPQLQKILWIEHKSQDDVGGRLLSFTLHPTGNTIEPYANASLSPIIAYNKILVLDTSARNQPHILWVNENQSLQTIDLTTNASVAFGHMYNGNTSNLVKDSGWLYWTDENNIVQTNHDAFHQYAMHMRNKTVLSMLPLNQQEYPALSCLLPQNTSVYDRIAIEGSSARSIVLRLPELKPYRNCTRGPPGIRYMVSYRPRPVDDPHIDCTAETCKTFDTFDLKREVSNLKPFTRYDFQMRVENHYSKLKNLTTEFGAFVTFSTKVDAPSEPRDVAAEAINPTEALVTWAPPLEFNGNDVWYEVHWQTKHAINGVTNRQQLLVNKSNTLTVTIGKLLPKQLYKVWVRAYTTNTSFSESDALEIETFPEPNNLTLANATSGRFVIHWSPYKDAFNCAVSYKQFNNDSTEWREIYNCNAPDKSTINGSNIIVSDLQPKTQYLFVVTLTFSRMEQTYEWDRKFVFETLPGRPNPPGKPNIKHVSGDVYKVFWAPAQNNGAEIEMYSLEALRYSISKRETRSTDIAAEILANVDKLSYTTMVTAPSLEAKEIEPLEDTWTVYYKGTETHWIIKDLVPIDKYSFRVSAKNSFGWSEYSELSDISNAPLPSSERYAYMMIATIIPISITLLLVLIACLFCSK